MKARNSVNYSDRHLLLLTVPESCTTSTLAKAENDSAIYKHNRSIFGFKHDQSVFAGQLAHHLFFCLECFSKYMTAKLSLVPGCWSSSDLVGSCETLSLP